MTGIVSNFHRESRVYGMHVSIVPVLYLVPVGTATPYGDYPIMVVESVPRSLNSILPLSASLETEKGIEFSTRSIRTRVS